MPQPREPEITQISIDQLVLPKHEVREYTEREKLEELARSLKEIGVLEPLLVERTNQKYTIIAGTRRFLAAQMAGLKTLPCVVMKFSAQKRDLAKIHENYMREDVSPLDLAAYLKYLKDRWDYKTDELGALFNRSGAWVSAQLRLLTCDKEIQQAVDMRKIDVTSGLAISSLPDREERGRILGHAVSSAASQTVIRNWVNDALRRMGQSPMAPPTSPGKPGPKETPPITFTCFGCHQVKPQDQMILIRLCPECYRAIKKAFDVMREDKDNGS